MIDSETVIVFPIGRWSGNEPASIAEMILGVKDRQVATGLWLDLISEHQTTLAQRGVPPAAIKAAVSRFTHEVREEIATLRPVRIEADG